MEAIVKIIALGFLNTSLKGVGMRAYLKNVWNAIDFFVLITSIFYLRQTLVQV
jgi:hypothetical protein